jgi:hypothetical protein
MKWHLNNLVGSSVPAALLLVLLVLLLPGPGGAARPLWQCMH